MFKLAVCLMHNFIFIQGCKKILNREEIVFLFAQANFLAAALHEIPTGNIAICLQFACVFYIATLKFKINVKSFVDSNIEF